MTLQDIRKEIDKIDYQIHDLLNERAKLALKVGKLKIQEDGESTEFFRPEREREILAAISKHNQGPLSDDAVVNIFRVIIQECHQLQVKAHKKETHHD